MASALSYRDDPDIGKFIKELNMDVPVCSNPFIQHDGDTIVDKMTREREWNILENRIKNFVKKNVMTGDGYLKEGLKLYHSSLDSNLDFDNFDKDKYTFFGLDIVISLWYILEMSESQEEKTGELPKYGYLYEFELKEPLKVNKYLEYIGQHPSEDDDCRIKLGVCVHPQITFHGNSRFNQGPFDLSIEVTLGNTSLSYLVFLKRYKVLVHNLKNFRSYPLSALDVISYNQGGEDMLTFIKTSELRNIEEIQMKNKYYVPKKESITRNFFNMKPNASRKTKSRKVRKTKSRKVKSIKKKSRKTSRKSRKTKRKTRK